MSVYASLIVDDVMKRWPETIRMFLDHGLLCVGCPVGGFQSIGESCLLHNLESHAFVRALADAIGDPTQPSWSRH